jgi:hypothetical protein
LYKIPFISVCIIDSNLRADINATNYTFSDFERKTLIGVCLDIEQDEILRPIEGTELPSELFSYIRSLCKHASSQLDETTTMTSSSSASTPRGGRTFTSVLKPFLVFVRYRMSTTADDMVEDLNAVMALEAFIRMKRFPGNVFSQQMMCMPDVARRVKLLRFAVGKKGLDLMDHEFDSIGVEMLTSL